MKRCGIRALGFVFVVTLLGTLFATPAIAASSTSDLSTYYTWGSDPSEIFCGQGQSSWSDAQTPGTSPVSGMTAQQRSRQNLYCENPSGMGAGYQFAEGWMLKWNGSSWDTCKTISTVYNAEGSASATAVRFNTNLCGVATYTVQGHYGVAWAFSWHYGWTATPNSVIY